MPKTDKTTKLPAEQRRMDELAWLLENASMCTAVFVINGRFYIATNEFFSHTEKKENNQQLNIIYEIMEYFKKVATNFDSTLRQQKRDGLMKSIVQNQLRVASFGRISIPDNIVDVIVCSDVLGIEKLPDISNKGLKEYIEKRKGQAHQALGYGIEIYKRFKKIERAIEKANSKDFSKISERQLNAFKTFNHSDQARLHSNILFLEKDGNKSVHAEAQILDQIVNFIDQKIELSPKVTYIGISKRCCKNCNCLLEATNEVLALEGSDYLIEFEGTHNAEFEAKWGRPPMLKQADLASISKTRGQTRDQTATKVLPLKEKINKRYTEKLTEIEQLSQGSYDQRHTPSSSEATSEINKERYKESLEEDLNALLRRELESSPQADLLRLGIRLCGVNEFTDFFDETLMSTQSLDKEVIIDSILIAYNKKNTDNVISKEILLQFLNNPKFCPEAICNYFFDKKEDSKFNCGSGMLAGMDQLPAAAFGSICSRPSPSTPITDEQESSLHAAKDGQPPTKRSRINSPPSPM